MDYAVWHAVCLLLLLSINHSFVLWCAHRTHGYATVYEPVQTVYEQPFQAWKLLQELPIREHEYEKVRCMKCVANRMEYLQQTSTVVGMIYDRKKIWNLKLLQARNRVNRILKVSIFNCTCYNWRHCWYCEYDCQKYRGYNHWYTLFSLFFYYCTVSLATLFQNSVQEQGIQNKKHCVRHNCINKAETLKIRKNIYCLRWDL